MDYYIAVFRSRSDAEGYRRELAARGVRCMFVATPTAARIGCGASVKVYDSSGAHYALVHNYKSFWGFI